MKDICGLSISCLFDHLNLPCEVSFKIALSSHHFYRLDEMCRQLFHFLLHFPDLKSLEVHVKFIAALDESSSGSPLGFISKVTEHVALRSSNFFKNGSISCSFSANGLGDFNGQNEDEGDNDDSGEDSDDDQDYDSETESD